MRRVLLLLVALGSVASFAGAVPRRRSKVTTASHAITPSRPVPLSPAQLRGKVLYVLGRDVWALEPKSRRKFLLYKNLFFPVDKSLDAYVDTYGSSLRFSRADIAWSPDLSRIAFTRRDPRFQGSELFVMRWDGREKRQLSNDGYKAVISSPRWSPDGNTIMFVQSSPYRMGGPGYGSSGVVLLGLDGKGRSFNNRDDKGNVLGGTFFDPYWSRDGQKILLSYSSESADYVDSTNTSLKVVSLDETPLVDFQNNWGDFLVDNQSRTGKWRLQHFRTPGLAYWERFRPDTIVAQGIVWQEDGGFKVTRFCVSDDGKEFIGEGNLVRWSISPEGVTTRGYLFGIWSFGFKENDIASPRLLIQDGQLVDWF